MPRGRVGWGGAPPGGGPRGAGAGPPPRAPPPRAPPPRDREPRSDLDRLGAGRIRLDRLGADDPSVLHQRTSRLGRLDGVRAGLLRTLEQQLIEPQPGHHEPEVRPGAELGPRQIDRHVLRVDAQTEDPLEAWVVGVDPHPLDRADAAGRQAVAADLLAWERGLVDEGDVDPVAREVIGGRRPTRAGTDDQHVGLDRLSHVAPRALPRRARRARPPLRRPLVKSFTSSLSQAVPGREPVGSRRGAGPRPPRPASRSPPA